MDSELFERLLYEEESTTLDFKKEQYRFAKAPEEEKSELLKDILGFANAWRRSTAYILIGVKDVRGGRADVVGIPESAHLDDHSLQQFVNSLTNQPVRFHYEAFDSTGKHVGIIVIDEQMRPIYLKRNYGKLLKEKVYVRRGSSTDPTTPASPEEIAQMRIGGAGLAADLAVEFSDVERDDSLGTAIALHSEFCEMPSRESIRAAERPQHPFGLDMSMFDPVNHPSDAFLGDLADFEFARRLFCPVRVVVRNVGHVAANNVRAELTVPAGDGLAVAEASDLPDPPRRGVMDFVSLHSVRPAFRRHPGDVDIDKNGDRFRVVIDCGDLQPGRQVWSDPFYMALQTSGEVVLSGVIFAANLPQPREFALIANIAVACASMTVEELRSLAQKREE